MGNQSSECCTCIRRFLPLLPMRRRCLFELISDPICAAKAAAFQTHSHPRVWDRRRHRERRRGVFDKPCIGLTRAVYINRFSMTRLLSFYCFCEIESSVG